MDPSIAVELQYWIHSLKWRILNRSGLYDIWPGVNEDLLEVLCHWRHRSDNPEMLEKYFIKKLLTLTKCSLPWKKCLMTRQICD